MQAAANGKKVIDKRGRGSFVEIAQGDGGTVVVQLEG